MHITEKKRKFLLLLIFLLLSSFTNSPTTSSTTILVEITSVCKTKNFSDYYTISSCRKWLIILLLYSTCCVNTLLSLVCCNQKYLTLLYKEACVSCLPQFVASSNVLVLFLVLIVQGYELLIPFLLHTMPLY